MDSYEFSEDYFKNYNQFIEYLVDVQKKEVVLTEEQRKAKEIRDFLNEKNRIFNNRMKHQNSITKNKSNLDFKEI